ncbi:TetR/AcrR family transcriptional regulator [Streptomyces sp. KL110A]|uniref:TetR/AcrR family transcriptional regulator n=1 Tax=Streptomyces sp. KL110A TaxID=3384221 RepID=UPI0038C0002B
MPGSRDSRRPERLAHTTVRDIAQAAGVGERTFFRCFPTKESLVAGQVGELVPRIAELLTDRPADEATYTAMRNAVQELAAQYDVPPALPNTSAPTLAPTASCCRTWKAPLPSHWAAAAELVAACPGGRSSPPCTVMTPPRPPLPPQTRDDGRLTDTSARETRKPAFPAL